MFIRCKVIPDCVCMSGIFRNSLGSTVQFNTFNLNLIRSSLTAQYKVGPIRLISKRPIPPPPPRNSPGTLTPPHPLQPPPGVNPLKLQPLPFARPRGPKPKGGLLLAIPIITFGLGIWQVKRLKWKTDMIETIKENSKMDPVPLPLDLDEVAKIEFRRVAVKGTFDHSKEIYYGPKPCIVDGAYDEQVISKTGRESHGYNLVTPFVLSDTGERILVNRGWIRTKTIKPQDRPWSKTEGEQTITGLVRRTETVGYGPPKKSKFSVWHYRDLEDISKHTDCLPIYIDATEEHSIPNRLWAGQTRINIRNEHLSYAITWFSLSVATSIMWYFMYLH